MRSLAVRCQHQRPKFGQVAICRRPQCWQERDWYEQLDKAVHDWPGYAGASLRRNMIVLDEIADGS